MTRKFGGVLVLVAMLLGAMSLAAPPAEAQVFGIPVEESDEFARLHLVGATEACPGGYSDAGPTGLSSDARWCLPPGPLTPITSSADCDAAIAALGVGLWTGSYCVSFGWSLADGDDCFAPGVMTVEVGARYCDGPIYLRTAGIGGGATHAPICIEDDRVQNDPALAALAVGNSFRDEGGASYLITSGEPSCSFNCYNGFDANCDGALGDYCSVELDLSRVADVGTCLAALSAPSEPQATNEVVAVSAPPAEAAASAPAPASAPTSLAHTGPSDRLPPFAVWLVGSGAAVLGLGRAVRGRSAD